METYDVTTQTNGLPAAVDSEDRYTKNIESYTAAIPSSAYLGVAVGAMALSLFCQITGRGKWGNFIAQWVPTWLIIGVYNKMVKLEGHDRYDRGITSEAIGNYNCEFCDSKFSLHSDLENHKKHCSVRSPVS
ncbi:MAG TPA: hypothetical protein VHK27_01910 [Gammaproteobacteria bacterium]|nr:hypothetical protein [Gammaproteobacteria bacterium]